MKTVYQLDQNGTYMGETVAHESPLEPGIYLIPGGCIETAPPVAKFGQVAVWNGKWSLVESPNAPMPENPTEEDLAAQKKAIRREAILSELNAIDFKSIRPLRSGDTERLAALEKQAVTLRNELAKL
jgi:hypothetical protein